MTMKTVLTQRQRQILQYIEKHIQEHECPPTVREIGRHFGIASPHGVTEHLRLLENKGCIRRVSRTSRGIRLLTKASGIPIVGDIAAGTPILAVENIMGTLDITSLFGTGDLFAVRVRGESMVNCGIMDGDYVIVRKAPRVENGAVAVAYIEGEATVKRVFKTKTGYRLQPENDAFKPIEVNEATPGFSIGGPVIGVVRAAVR